MQLLLQTATNHHRPALEQLLLAQALLIEDLPAALDTFTLAFDGDTLVGSAGMEILEAYGLFRSVAVHPGYRNLGLGQKLHDAAMVTAKKAGIREVWLITNTADRYFEKLGFERVERADTPPEIAGTAQFSELCPSTAVVMKKSTVNSQQSKENSDS